MPYLRTWVQIQQQQSEFFLTQAVATNGFPFEIKRKIKSNPYEPMTEKELLAKLERSRE